MFKLLVYIHITSLYIEYYINLIIKYNYYYNNYILLIIL